MSKLPINIGTKYLDFASSRRRLSFLLESRYSIEGLSETKILKNSAECWVINSLNLISTGDQESEFLNTSIDKKHNRTTKGFLASTCNKWMIHSSVALLILGLHNMMWSSVTSYADTRSGLEKLNSTYYSLIGNQNARNNTFIVLI